MNIVKTTDYFNKTIQELSELRNDGQTYKTSVDGTEDREKVIEAFNQLY